MPVTAKLSKAFYDKIGDQAAGELVNWMNTVHEDARADLREFNELNYARFDAKLEQRLAGIGARLDRLETRFDRLEAKVNSMHTAAMIDAKFAALTAQIDARIERMQKEMTRFVFLAWMTLLIPIIGLWMR
jgi:hypothetical protein